MQIGKVVSGAGCGRRTGDSWLKDFVMLVEVYAETTTASITPATTATIISSNTTTRLRLLSGASPVKLIKVEENGNGNEVWKAVSLAPGPFIQNWEGGYHRWPAEVVVGPLSDNPVEHLCEIPLTVEIMLMDRRSGKMALWHRADKCIFGREDINDVHTPMRELNGRCYSLVEQSQSFHQVCRLIKLPHGGLTYLGCVLEINTTGHVRMMDFRTLFSRRLTWV